VKWTCEPARAEDVPLAIARAYYEAMTPPRGPTFVSVPIDDWDRECEWVDAREIATFNPGDPNAIARLARALSKAQRPAFVCGAGTARDGAWEALVTLAEQQNASVYTCAYSSRNVFPESHKLFRGFLPPFKEKLNEVLAEHDFILTMGGPLNLYHAEGFGPHVPDGAEVWHVGDNSGLLSLAPVGNGILANTRAVAEQLLTRCAPSKRAAPPTRAKPPALDRKVMNDKLAMQCIAEALPANANITEEAPTSRGAVQTYLRVNRKDSFFTTASGGLGYSLPAAIGVALARPDERTVAIIGDGSAMYGIQALFSAYQLNLPITFVIINNQKYEALRSFGQVFGMQKVVGTDLAGLDFCALAKGHGLPAGKQVSDADALEKALAAAFRAKGPNLIEVMVY
jgi:benzoylformate decarboxylase